jgi:hypothetical protein
MCLEFAVKCKTPLTSSPCCFQLQFHVAPQLKMCAMLDKDLATKAYSCLQHRRSYTSEGGYSVDTLQNQGSLHSRAKHVSDALCRLTH